MSGIRTGGVRIGAAWGGDDREAWYRVCSRGGMEEGEPVALPDPAEIII